MVAKRAVFGFLLSATGAQGYRIGVLWPEHCAGDDAEFCTLLTKGAQAALTEWKKQSQAEWTPQLVHPYDKVGPASVHDTFDGMCQMVNTGVSAFVGPLTAREGQLIGRFAGWHQVPMVTPAASAEELGDRTLYPYLRRTHPSVVAQGDAIAEFVRRLNWTSIGVLFEKHNTRYESLMRALTSSFAYFGGRTAHVEALDSGKEVSHYSATLRHLREGHVQVIAVLGTARFISSITAAALAPEHPPALFGSGRVWFASEEAPDPLIGLSHLWHSDESFGCGNASLSAHDSRCTCEACQEQLSRVGGLLSVALPINESNHHVQALAHHLGFHDDELRKLDIYERTAYDAVYHALAGLQATGLLKWMDEHTFDGATGHIDFNLMDSAFRHDLVNLQKLGDAHAYEWQITGTYYPRSDWPADGTHTAAGTGSGAQHWRHAQLLAGSPTASPAAGQGGSEATGTGSGDEAAGEVVVDHPLKVAVYDGSAIAHRYCSSCVPFEWPGHGVPPDPLHLLKGLHLHILVREDPPYVYANHSRKDCDLLSPAPETGCYRGALWDLLVDFAHRFQFTFDTTLTHGHLHDSIELLGQLHGRYDMLLANIAITEARLQIVDLTQPLFETETVMIARRPNPSDPSYFFFLEPFEPTMWVCVIGFVLANAVVFYWLERGVSDGVDSGLRGGEDALYFSFTAFLFTADIAPATRGGRILTAGFYFAALIALSTFTAQLTVFLLQQGAVYEFDNFASFLPGTGKHTMSQMLVAADSVEARWVCITCSCCQKPGGGPTLVDFMPATATSDEVHAHHRIVEMLKEPCDTSLDGCPIAGVMEKFQAQYVVRENCGLSIHHSAGQGIASQDPVPHLQSFGMGIALVRESPYTTVISEEILHLKESQRISELQNKWFSNSECPSVTELPAKSQIEVKDFIGMYIIFGALVVITLAYKEIWTKYMLFSGGGVDVDGDGQVDDVVGPKQTMSFRREKLVHDRIDRLLNQLQDGNGPPRKTKSQGSTAVSGLHNSAQIQVAPLTMPDVAPPLPPPEGKQ
eukprot:TRINITY_DN10139_c0_g1_i2.p1 TRINITY_DN10139_c0_g1~~TRINITY_DN10139_c0_g1_i2.p1  ORF type:complete len:1034 (+),score=242.53 TRINITY_DN10139_c0_g1_i2:74-3175(+)